MSRTSLIFLAAIFVLFALSLLIVLRKPASPVLPPETVLSAQENSGGEVDIKATPLILKAGEKPQFEIEFNTHSVELDFDISQIASLTDEKLNAYTSSTWEGSPPGGHHRKGILKFKAIYPKPKVIQLKISQVGNIEERIFKWELK